MSVTLAIELINWDTFELNVPLSTSIGDLKAAIDAHYEKKGEKVHCLWSRLDFDSYTLKDFGIDGSNVVNVLEEKEPKELKAHGNRSRGIRMKPLGADCPERLKKLPTPGL
jgi:hypothetical protein